MFTEFIYITLITLFFFWMCKEDFLADAMSFETFLRSAISEYINNMDYMNRGAHQKRAPTTFSQPLVGLGSHYRRRHKSFS